MILKDNEVIIVKAPVTAGTSDVTDATIVDCSDCEGVTYFVAFGAITGSAVTSIYVQESAASDMTGAATISGTTVTVADTDDSKVAIVSVKPSLRYTRVIIDRGTQNAVVDLAWAIKEGCVKKPVTQGSTVIATSVEVGR